MRTQKDRIWQVLTDCGSHKTADEVYLACRRQGMSVSLATVYRNLGLMAQDGTIRRFSIPGKADIFDITPTEHCHKVCVGCGDVSDVDVGDIKAELEKRAGISIADFDLCVRYVCPRCQAAVAPLP